MFSDTRRTVEDIMKDSSFKKLLERANVLENGDIEVLPEWDAEVVERPE